MKKAFALVLVVMLALSATSALAISGNYLDYVDWPVTDSDVTYTIGIKLKSQVSDFSMENNWFFNWAMEKTGLKFEVEGIQDSALSTTKQLLFNSDQLPDVMWGWGLTPAEMVKYGSQEGMLLPLNEYFNEELMPNLSVWLEVYPDIFNVITAPDGNYYSMPFFYKLTRSAGGSTAIFINQTHLEEIGKEKPTTLDEMIDVLYAYKEPNPDLTPISASSSGYNIFDFFLNAYGFVLEGGNDYGSDIAMRNGEVVIPVGDPLFKEFLTLMNKFYNDGIIYQDYFLLDKDSVTADQTARNGILMETQPTGDTYEDWKHWTANSPLTREYNETPIWLGSKLYQTGGLALSSYIEQPELFMQFIDFVYSDLGVVYSWNGPLKGSEDAMGMENVGYYIAEDGNFVNVGVENGVYGNANENNLHFQIPSGQCVGANCCSAASPELNTEVALLTSAAGLKVGSTDWNVTGNKDNYFRASMEEFVTPYETTNYPFYVYMAEEQTNRVNELKTVIDPYVQKEVAEFITGARSLDEFDQFVTELEGMGLREIEEIYREAVNF